MGYLLSGALEGSGLGNVVIQALQNMYANDQALVDTTLTAQERGNVASAMFAETGETPQFYIGKLSAGIVVVLVGGVGNLQMGINLYAGYGGSPTVGANRINQWAQRIQGTIVGLVKSKDWWDVTARFIVAGHSGGGMVANLIADQHKAEAPQYETTYHTFGSPRVTTQGPADIALRTPGVRWMYSNDPVPLLPLRFSQAPWIVPIVGLQAALNAGNYVHWHGGYQLVDGHIGHPEELPTLAEVNPVTNLASWLFNIDSSNDLTHSVATYARLVQNEVNLIRTPTAPISNLVRTEPVESSSRRVVQRQEQEVANSIVQSEHAQNSIPVLIPPSQAWQAVRVGRIWTVQLGGQIVTIAGSKKAARALARQMNDAFARLQRAAVVDPNALKQQMGDYLDAATDPSGPFLPVMNTTFGV